MRHRTSLKLLVALSALALFAAACGGDEGAATTTRAGTTTTAAGTTTTGAGATTTRAGTITTNTKSGGSVVFGADQEPKIFNTLLGDGQLFANAAIAKAVLPSMMLVQPDFSFKDYVQDGEPTVESKDPLVLTWKIKKEAKWSDGTDLTADDVKATFDYIMDEGNDIADRTGYDKIDKFEIKDPKTFTLTFKEPFAPYRLLFSLSGFFQKKALDEHKASGGTGNDFMKDGIPFAGGPFKLEAFVRGEGVTLVKNDAYWGKNKPALDKIIFRFIEDSQAQVTAIESKEIDIIYPQPQVAFIQAAQKIDFASYQVSLGTVWEHVDFNFKVPALADPPVRKAMAYGINRNQIIETLIKPLVGTAEVKPLGNVSYVPNQKEYTDAFSQYAYDQVKAEKLLEDAGYTKGADGIRAKGDQKLSFAFSTTAGNKLRELQQQLIQQDLQKIGIEVKIANRPASELFTTDVLRSGNWDILMFAYVASPDPAGSGPIFRGDKCPKTVPGCTAEDGGNYQQYKNDKVTQLLIDSDKETDAAKRAALVNDANELIGEDVPVLPLYQKATFVLHNKRLVNVVDNPTQEGPLWNVELWALAS